MGLFDKIKSSFSKVETKAHGQTSISGFGMGYSFNSYNDTKVLHKSYLQNDDVYSIVSKGARTIANNIGWNVYEVNKKGEKVQVFDNELIELLYSPNAYQTLGELREQAYTFLMVTGKSFIGGINPVGFKGYGSLHNLPSQIVEMKLGSLENPIEKYICDWNLQKEWMPEDVLYTKYVNVDAECYFEGLSPLRAGARLLESSNNLVTADASTLKNRGASGLLTNRSEEVMLDKEREELQKAVDNQMGGAEKFNKVLTSSANVDYIPFGMSPKDLEILKSDISKRRRFSNLWGFDSAQFNDPDNKTFNNQRESSKSAYMNVYIPTDRKFVDGLNKWLCPKYMTKNGSKLIIEQDLSGIEPLQQDKKLVSEIAQKTSVESRLIIQDYNNGILPREGALILLTSLGHDEEQAGKLLNTTIRSNEGQ